MRPPWEAPLDGDGIDLVIDPGQAFGAHHTTRLCLELLLEREPRGALADWGCGTGVLAIAAARLGWDPVLACDWEAAAVEATRDNAALNSRAGQGVTVERVDLRRAAGPWVPTVVANLVRPLLLEVAGLMTRPPTTLIASGLLREEADEVAAAFARHGLGEIDRRHGGECRRCSSRGSLGGMAWNVLILGGGFGGLTAARPHLERKLPPHSAKVTLVNDVNYMFYTPLPARRHARAAARGGAAA